MLERLLDTSVISASTQFSPSPRSLSRNPPSFPIDSDDFHWAVLEQGFGGYYPAPDQLRRCAEGYFSLVEEVGGTVDYRLTSEEWLRRVRQRVTSLAVAAIEMRSIPVFFRSPRQFLRSLVLINAAIFITSLNSENGGF
jgi:hypothetical protein